MNNQDGMSISCLTADLNTGERSHKYCLLHCIPDGILERMEGKLVRFNQVSNW
jgi:hypothetical protein